MVLGHFSEAVQAVSGPDELLALASEELQELGFCDFAISKMDSWSMSGMLGFADLSHFEDYIGSKRYLVDPVFRRVKEGWLPVPWEARDYIDQEEPWSELFQLTLEAGYERGISLPISGPFGNRFTMVAFYGATQASFRQNIDNLCDSLLLLGYHLVSAKQSLHRKEFPRQTLSSREHECLSWALNGKTAWETGKIIGISERTVHFHVQNAMVKLDVSSKVAACLKAVELGILDTQPV